MLEVGTATRGQSRAYVHDETTMRAVRPVSSVQGEVGDGDVLIDCA